jgi:hypothetical protein
MKGLLRIALTALATLGMVAFAPGEDSAAQQGPSLARGWEHVSLGGASPCNGKQTQVGPGGPGLVAFDGCNEALWSSSDGKSWQTVSLPPLQLDNASNWNFFVSGQVFLLLGQVFSTEPGPAQTAVWISADAGTSWRRSSTDLQFLAATSGGDGLLAAARDPHSFNAGLWTSSDGLTWHPVPDSAGTFASADIRVLIHAGSRWVAAGQVGGGTKPPSPAIWTSSDGRTWSQAPDNALPAEASITSLAAGSHAILAVYSGPNISGLVVSQDGLHWQQSKSFPPSPSNFYFGHTGIASWQGGFVSLEDEGGETALWSSPDGLSWTRVGGDEIFGGSAQIGDVASFGGGIVAIGSFAPHPQPACLRGQGADSNDIRTFGSAVFLWSPGTSASAPAPAIDRSDPQLSKLLYTDLPSAQTTPDYYSYRTAYLNFCTEAPLLGKHRAYRVQLPTSSGGSAGLPPNVQAQELTIVAETVPAAHSAFLKLKKWMFAGTDAKQAKTSAHIGDATRAYSFHLPTDIVPSGTPYRGYAVVWNQGQVIGEVFATNLHLAATLAQRQFDRMQRPAPAVQLEADR